MKNAAIQNVDILSVGKIREIIRYNGFTLEELEKAHKLECIMGKIIEYLFDDDEEYTQYLVDRVINKKR